MEALTGFSTSQAKSKPIARFIGLLVIMVIFLSPQGSSAAPVKQIRRVLIFYELGLSSPAITRLDQEIRIALDNSLFQIELYREYLETTLFPDPKEQHEIREGYLHKYRDRKPDLIIVLRLSPLKFLADVHERAFKDVPVVFELATAEQADYPSLSSQFTGVWDTYEPQKTVEVALRLQPGTKHVVVLGGKDTFDLQLEAWFHERLRRYESSLDITYITDLPMPQLLDHLSHLPPNTVVLLTHIGQDAAGTRFVGAAQADPIVVKASNAPVFGASDVDMGHGEVGGYLDSFASQGRNVGEMAKRILNGESPKDIPVVKETNLYMFDWQALRRWGLEESNLPPGSLVLNRQATLWERGWKYFIVGIAVILLQAISILTLFRQRARKRKTEAELVTSEEKFSKTFRHSPLILAISRTSDFRFIDVNESFEQQVGWKREEVIGRTPLDLHLWANANQRAEFVSHTQNNRSVRNLEAFIRRKDGEIRTFLVSGEVLEVSGQNCTLSVGADITGRKQAEEMLSTMSRRLIEAQEKERTWIARELHDDFSQRVAMVSVNLDCLERGLSGSEVQAKSYAEEIKEQIMELGSDIHALSHRLHSSKLDYLGLTLACKGFCTELSTRQSVEIEFHSENIPRELSKEISIGLFRVLQEALQNAVKYSGVRNFQVVLKCASREVELSVRDSGSGFDLDEAMSGEGLGLTSMKERLKLVDGQLSIESKPGMGTTICARVNLSPEAASRTMIETRCL